MHGFFGCQNKFKMKTPASRKIVQELDSGRISASVLKLARLAFYEAMVPTLHYLMNADEDYDGLGGRVATINFR